MKYTLDAQNKKIGRVATQAAVYLMGKNTPSFKRNLNPETVVEIINASKASVAETKMDTKTYSRYSGYPGGLKQPTMKQVIVKKGYSEIMREAVSGMIPKNKLRAKMLKNLIITE
ncbi:MAG: 50S ribosomal protein L13 [Candidatus Zambryskibacteria bacterium RIFOXYD1_FULL_40_13]|nr:MAG: 50S ribosomal protein L13 [Parcubacteria group bacterium GW2011_GWC1_39_12]KKR19669.1 MAG: 50S ribosomal protein L13 [Parcubacteria group bacterium GW2011_GWF1_39_37]KKR35825.1 MAG: 50S ribosomal protein L13 [Parcubacteria group bacterium GW2011_GWC2_40_10]KKR52637.1 MAG: 50S ribosomal protein L13 [Parcubacteria group bacterium GW2011_GWE1_40_20]KKR65656.1 MAG: 50S ribosomal protein L13 [Parcubacteria group bacterium GW2011_GWB1_40_5]KKR68900.1 MAG: 50S ribosomal protein L13 [Parcubact